MAIAMLCSVSKNYDQFGVQGFQGVTRVRQACFLKWNLSRWCSDRVMQSDIQLGCKTSARIEREKSSFPHLGEVWIKKTVTNYPLEVVTTGVDYACTALFFEGRDRI